MSNDVLIDASSDSGSPKQGCPDNWGAIFTNGVTTAYCSLSKNGVEETYYSRFQIDTAQPWAYLIPQSFGTDYTVVAYDAATAGNVIGTSASFSVDQAILPTLPIPETSKVVILGDSTTQQNYTLNANPAYANAINLNRYAGYAPRLMGYPANWQIWPAYHNSNGGDGVPNGGAAEGVSSDASLPYPTHPGFTNRLYRILEQRPDLLIVTVSANDVNASGYTAAQCIAAYQAIADQATRAGCIVMFAMMRAGGVSDQTMRVAINNGVASICGSVTGCYFYDPCTIYTKVGGGMSSYNDPTPTVDDDLINGPHPTPRGGRLEADVLVSKCQAINLFGSNNYCLTVYNNAAGEQVLSLYPNFNGGNNPSPTLTGNITGTILNGFTRADAPSGVNSTVVASVVANPDTGGNSQQFTITPAGTGLQFLSCTTPNQTISGYLGYLECMTEIDIISDTENMIMSIQYKSDSRATGGSFQAATDGEPITTTLLEDTPPPYSGTQKFWFYHHYFCDGTQTINLQTWNFILNATSKTANVVVQIKRHMCRKITIAANNPRTLRILPLGGTTERVASTSGTITARLKYASTGVKPQGARFYTRQNNNFGWTYRGEAYSAPGDTGVSYTITGLTPDGVYSVRAVPLRAANVLPYGTGKFYCEGTPGNVVLMQASNLSKISGCSL